MGISGIHWFWRTLALLLVLGAGMPSLAQVPAFRRIDGKDGLPQSQVQTFLEDHHGFLWVGTLNGVARLGAGGFKVFDLSSGLGAGRVYEFLEDDQGGVWVAQSGAPLARIQGSQVEYFEEAKGLPETDCFTLALSPKNQVLVGTAHGLYGLTKGRFEKVRLGVGWENQQIRSMVFDRQGILWLGQRNGMVGQWDGTRVQVQSPKYREALPRINQLRMDPEGSLWALTQKELWSRSPKGAWSLWQGKGFPGAALFEGLTISADGYKLLSLGGKGVWIQPPQGPGILYNSKNGLPDERVNTSFRDSRGILWVGTNGEGIHVLAYPGLRSLTRMGEAPIGAALCMEESGGDSYIGTGRGLFLWKDGQGISRRWTTADGLPGNEIWGICSDGRGGLWVGSDRGLARLKEGRLQVFPAFKDLRITQILQDGKSFLLATDRGIVRIDGEGRWLKRLDISKYKLPLDVVVMAKARNPKDRILVGSGLGLWEIQGEHLQQIHQEAPFSTVEVVSLFEHLNGDLWVGTSKGLYIHRGGIWHLLAAPADLPNNYVYFLGEARDGLVAVGHGKGVTLMDGKGQAFHMNQNLGLVANESNQGAVFKDSKGRLWMGLASGLNILEPTEKLQLPDLPPPAILDIRYSDGSSPGSTKVTLPPRPEFVEFDFEEGLPITANPAIFEAKLEGQSTAWQRIGDLRQMRYSRLPGGSYTFRLRASLDGQKWVEGIPVSLTVKPTLAEHPLGQMGILVLLTGGVLGLVSWRTRRLQIQAQALEAKVEDRTQSLDQRNHELEEANEKVRQSLESKIAFSRMVVHDLRSPLTTMTLLAERMAFQAEERGEAPPEEIEMLQREARRLEDLLQRLLDQARGEATGQTMSLAPTNPHEVLEGLAAVLHLKATAAGLAFEFQEEPAVAGAIVQADSLAIQQVVLNLFGNALKCTRIPGRLGLKSLLAGGAWVLEVSDTGRGLKPNQIQNLFKPFTQAEMSDITEGWGLGLSIVKTLVDAHQGLIEVDSVLGKGTTFRVLIPLTSPG